VRNATGLMVFVTVYCVGVAACSSPSQPQASTASSTTHPPATMAISAAQPAATTASASPGGTAAPNMTAPCIGLSICPTPPPDAEDNPACYYRDGWDADPSGSGINVYYFREPSDKSGPEQITADLRMKDGTTASQIASIDAGQTLDQIQFPGIDKAAVQEVLLTSSTGRCFVIGPSGS
jgi:hypothetical protein